MSSKVSAWHYSVSDLCQVLALLLKTPTIELTAAMTDGAFFDDLIDILEELALDEPQTMSALKKARSHCAAQGSHELLHELRKEYTRMFIRTSQEPKVDIYEAPFVARRKNAASLPLMFINPEAIELSAIYQQIGIVRDTQFNYSEDHLSFEFAFLSKIHQLSGLAGEQRSDLESLLKEFHKKHFDRWAGEFFSVCEEVGKNDLYRFFWRLGYDFSKTLMIA
ncbi:MAG: molecular chaperone TorD family protein [Coriobacteriales bacterium]|jgi:TorA maturation chaperone TorD|nr:molecular chaperone TorD family protein [Coriobacteriales bacterium]